MINLIDFQNSFLIEWGCRLQIERNEEWTIFPQHLLHNIGGLSIFKSNISSNQLQGLNLVENIFWKAVVKA